MRDRKRFKFVSGAAVFGGVLAAALSNGCSTASTLAGAAQGCDEFSGGVSSVASLSIDADTKAFVTAAANLQAVATSIEGAVMTACINMDVDLGVQDTWDAKTSNDDKLNEACTQLSTKIQAILAEPASASASVTLAISGGECTVDASAQATCEGSCNAQASCTEPDITVRCSPGELSGQCSGSCSANAYCEGSVQAEATCNGTCQANCDGTCTGSAQVQVDCNGTCTGNCTGTCNGANSTGSCSGTCAGKCDAACTSTGSAAVHCQGQCNGKCTGTCQLSASGSANCGANVNCRGGCSVAYTAPQCEGKLSPPTCQGDANCQASCSGSAELTAKCTPPTVSLEYEGTASADLQALITTIGKNFPAIVLAVETQGKLAVDAAGNVVTTGKVVVSNLTSIGGKALACAAVAAQASVTASASVSVSVQASASVSGSAGGPSS